VAFVLWMTGLSCSGKTTIAIELNKIFPNMEVLDGDKLWEWLAPLDMSKKARIAQTLRIAHIVKMLIKHDISVCVSIVSSFEESRKKAEEIINDDRFVLCHIKCPVEVCEKRDVKGMYKDLRNGGNIVLSGVNDPYDIPKEPDIVLETDKYSVSECIEKLKDHLIKNNLV
jgi:adenylylsulfate kinase